MKTREPHHRSMPRILMKIRQVHPSAIYSGIYAVRRKTSIHIMVLCTELVGIFDNRLPPQPQERNNQDLWKSTTAPSDPQNPTIFHVFKFCNCLSLKFRMIDCKKIYQYFCVAARKLIYLLILHSNFQWLSVVSNA